VASNDNDVSQNIEWQLTFGRPVGKAPDGYMDQNMRRKMRIKDKRARRETLRILCTIKAKSICGSRDKNIFQTKASKLVKRTGSAFGFDMCDADASQSDTEQTKSIIPFSKNDKPIFVESLRRTKSMPILFRENDMCIEHFSKPPPVREDDSEDSFDKDFTIFRELREQELHK